MHTSTEYIYSPVAQQPFYRPADLGSTIDDRIGQIFYRGMSLQRVERHGFESATNLQYRLFCNQGADELCIRMKAASLNEAIAYYRMLQTQDALCQFIPQFYGVVDQAGVPINLEQELASANNLEELRLKYPSVYILLRDLAQDAEGEENIHVVETPCDFKFARPSLFGDRFHPRNNILFLLHEFFRKIFFLLSGCSFAFQRRNRSLPWIIEGILRVFQVLTTRYKLREQFERVASSELLQVIAQLRNLQTASATSRFVFADSSLVFLPTEKEGRKSLRIHLVDLDQAFEDKEVMADFAVMKADITASLGELIALAEDVYRQTAEGFSPLSVASSSVK